MAPKNMQRKRAETTVAPTGASSAPTTRGSHNSTRAAKASEDAASKSAPAATASKPSAKNTNSEAKTAPPAKKPKTAAKPKATKGKATTKGALKAAASFDDGPVRDDESIPSKLVPKTVVTKTLTPKHEVEHLMDVPLVDSTTSPTKAPPPLPKSYERYSATRALTLFETYADPDVPDVISPEGFTQLCTDAHIPMDGALPLVLAWQLQAKEMGKLTRAEWVKAMSSLLISSLPQLHLAVTDLESLLIRGSQPLKRTSSSTPAKKKAADEPYDRTMYETHAADRKAAFLKLYTFCFALAKPEQARNIDMETATAFWSVLLMPQYAIMGEVIEFINEKGTYKGANKDLWSMMLEFCQTVKPSLENYEADGAWPTLLDDFASWKKSKMSNGQSTALNNAGHDA